MLDPLPMGGKIRAVLLEGNLINLPKVIKFLLFDLAILFQKNNHNRMVRKVSKDTDTHTHTYMYIYMNTYVCMYTRTHKQEYALITIMKDSISKCPSIEKMSTQRVLG